ncbi:MAG: hypothetical protein DRO88_02595 [Promethearchaeia archaeon]|nr:MAG: hypothetical protein DRO88_02595 [Candidatus Lokiarchaeia archaeon]
MMTRKNVLDKILKLLALSKNNSETHEAKAAKAKAAKLMAQFDIKIAEAEEKPLFTEQEVGIKSKNPQKYDTTLRSSIANFNGVALIMRKLHSGSAYLYVGRTVDIEQALYMSDIIYRQRDIKWKEYLKSLPKLTTSQRGKERRLWRAGFALGIREKLKELTEMKNTHIQERGLTIVPLNVQALREFKKNNRLQYSRSRGSSYSDAGFQAGKSTSIHKGVSKQSSIKRLN